VERIGVMHLVDTLDRGGMERVAVNLVNHLPRERFRVFLCTTRHDGPLADLVADDVERLCLARRRRLDVGAFRQLVGYIRSAGIHILHAHGTSLLVAAVASFFPPYPKLVWHVHFGHYANEQRSALAYRLLASRARSLIAVNSPLVDWARKRLCFPPNRTWYIPNFVAEAESELTTPVLPGHDGYRIVCAGNLRPEKDHLGLLAAMSIVVQHAPSAHLLLLGATSDAAYFKLVLGEIAHRGLASSVSLLGGRSDVLEVLRACDIGVLSSTSEGFPLALLEYGVAGLPVVATRVGHCPEVLDDGEAGVLVPAGRPDQLAAALLSLLGSSTDRVVLGERLRARVRKNYSPGPNIPLVCRVYETVLEKKHG
jgi:glycosyltransferase involved in cell wall biosynthesis